MTLKDDLINLKIKIIMKNSKNNLQKLVLTDGKFSGGFTSLDANQLNKIKGGNSSAVNNCNCNNAAGCNKQTV